MTSPDEVVHGGLYGRMSQSIPELDSALDRAALTFETDENVVQCVVNQPMTACSGEYLA
jgi:hypothetical protein